VSPSGRTEVRVVDDRTFLLGLDSLYRERMKTHERAELLACARVVSRLLSVGPADVPVEGYYTEDAELTEYFRRMRALQVEPPASEAVVAKVPEFRRLRAVTTSPMFGKQRPGGSLFPGGVDPLTEALEQIAANEWCVATIAAKAREIVQASDDFSLVGLAAWSGDAVVLTALRETVVLYAMVGRGMPPRPEEIRYEWRVDPELEQRAKKFVAEFNRLFDEKLPEPGAAQAEKYWKAGSGAAIHGRCVRIGFIPGAPEPHYHWAVRAHEGGVEAHEFWHQDLWTTARFRTATATGATPGG
jgi:hypothetical protein